MPPLNPQLHDALKRRFRRVEIGNQGERHVASKRPSPYRRGRWQPDVQFPGEYYKVSCPFCNDTRGRLWINHKFGVIDPETGDDRLFLAHCFNEECIDSRERQRELYDMIFPFNYGRRVREGDLPATGTAEEPETTDRHVLARWPSLCLPLRDVSRTELARQYLAARKFDPDEVADKWRVFYCPTSSDPPPAFVNRLVIPVSTLVPGLARVDDAIDVGWQARAIGPLRGNEPKYLSMKGMKKSRLLYGLPEAVRTGGPIVIVEGPTDVWRLKTNAVALFGKDMSTSQRDLVLRRFKGRPVVLLLDQDALCRAVHARNVLIDARRSWRDDARVTVGMLPKGRDDVGDCTTAEAWDCVARALGQPASSLEIRWLAETMAAPGT